MCDIFIWRCEVGESCKPPVSSNVFKIHVYNHIMQIYIYIHICIQKAIIVFQQNTREYSRKWAEYGVIHPVQEKNKTPINYSPSDMGN